ncbi:kinase [Bacillus coahuilensis p1.1.43]|uniref:Kinase n=1 Tax=Bacillus coahuilensis p1.1.43 TaxID=1150625 RepID=A0A147K7V7_9BACI|nr:carbohydrate kinase family protein [Bacillus coahuilensis]KUP06212.1 kinase [Bacillus coahuilensis p1.1.43]
MKKILVIGGTTYDSIITLEHLPEPKSQTIHYAPFHETIGSTGAGKALNLAKLNVQTTLHSIIGKDDYGEKIIQYLEGGNVDFVYDFDPKGTERHVNIMNQQGDRISIFVSNSSEELPLNMNRLEELIEDCDLIVLNIISYTKQLIPLIKKHKKPVWTDLHDYDVGNPYHQDYIEIADYIFLSSDQLNEYKPIMEKWISEGKQLVVCTHGKKGATALTQDRKWVEMPIISSYPFVDANGAGDSFFSGFLYGYLHGNTTEESLRFATICGGLCVTSKELVMSELSEETIQVEFKKHYT